MSGSEQHLAGVLDEMLILGEFDIMERMLTMCAPTFALHRAYSCALQFGRMRAAHVGRIGAAA